MGTPGKRLSLTDRLCEYGSYLQYRSGGSTKKELRLRMEKLVRIALERELTERQRVCLQYYYFDRMKAEDIAALLGVKPTTVYKHIRLAVKSLRKCAAYL